MNPFSPNAAKHFANCFDTDAPESSVRALVESLRIAKKRIVIEGTDDFRDLTANLLREVDRSILLSCDCYSCSLDSIRASSSSWSVVTLYYSAFHMARAVLGALGCWMGPRPDTWIDVKRDAPGSQSLQIHSSAYPTRTKGSHRITWNAFYSVSGSLRSWLRDADASTAASPVGSNPAWLIETRNRLNYESSEALELVRAFQRDYDKTDIPGCLPGRLNQMLGAATNFMALGKEVAHRLEIASDTFHDRAQEIASLVNASQDDSMRTFVTGRRASASF